MTDQATATQPPRLLDTIVSLGSYEQDVRVLREHSEWHQHPTMQQTAAYIICTELYVKRRVTFQACWNSLRRYAGIPVADSALVTSWSEGFTAAWNQVKAQLAAAA